MPTPNTDYEWKRCRECRLYSTRRNVVLTRTGYCSRGNYVDTSILPPNYPHILFIGEAPGAQEDHSGLPFQGASGRILHLTWSFIHSSFNYTICNIVGCRPTTEDFRGDTINREPSLPEIEACRPRLDQLVTRNEYAGVVYLGKVAATFSPKQFLGPKNLFSRALQLTHPAAILRMEFKLHTIKSQALLLDKYVKSLTLQGSSNLHR